MVTIKCGFVCAVFMTFQNEDGLAFHVPLLRLKSYTASQRLEANVRQFEPIWLTHPLLWQSASTQASLHTTIKRLCFNFCCQHLFFKIHSVLWLYAPVNWGVGSVFQLQKMHILYLTISWDILYFR